MKRWLILLFLLPVLSVSAQDLWCPEPTNRLVNDYSGMLTPEQQQALETRCRTEGLEERLGNPD